MVGNPEVIQMGIVRINNEKLHENSAALFVRTELVASA